MARAAVFDLLSGDTQLAELGGTGFVVVPNFEADQRPNDAGAFVVIAWRDTDFAEEVQQNGPQHFDLYFHLPVAVSTDFVTIEKMIGRADDIFTAVCDSPVTGGDGLLLWHVGFEGRGPDVKDEGYQTICKQASYFALSDKATA